MSEEINKIIDNLEGCIGIFDYLLTPVESNLLVSYIKELQQEAEKLQHYKKLYQSLKKQKEELRDYLKARIEVCDNRLSMPFCDPEKATKERLILNQCLEKMEELEGVNDEN